MDQKKLEKWKILKTEPAFTNPWWDIKDETVRLPDGSQTHFFVNHTLGGVIAFPITDDGEVVLVRQYKHGARKILLELPVGRIEESDADPETAARRELREETGYEPAAMTFVRGFQIFSTSSTGKFQLYVARGCRKVGEPMDTPKEITEVVTVPLRRVREMLAAGKIDSIVHVGAVYAALDWLEHNA